MLGRRPQLKDPGIRSFDCIPTIDDERRLSQNSMVVEHLMVGHDDGIQARLHGGLGNILMRSAAIRVACMHMQINDDFVHATSS